MTELDALRADWLRLHALDARATVFMSWPWLRAWAEVSPYPWSVLVAREEGTNRIAGVFPISQRGKRAVYRLDQVREIHFMGDEVADYRGFVCDPAREDDAVDAFADALIADRGWDRTVLKDALDDRLPRFIARLRQREPSLDVKQTEGNACPLLELPQTWESYLAECLTPPSRKSLKKRLRIADEAGCRLTTTGASTASAASGDATSHLETLIRIAGMRGTNSPEHLQRCRTLFESCLADGVAEIAVLWIGDEPAAAQGSFIDGHAKAIGHYLTGYDDRFADLSPGRVLDALSIRSAIERGFKAVDFLRGDETYKQQFGATLRFTQHAVIRRQGLNTRVRSAVSTIRRRAGL